MAIEYKKKSAQFVEQVDVSETDTFFQWLQANPKATVNLARCTHLHAALLQILMLTQARISAWPADSQLNQWLSTCLKRTAMVSNH